MNIKTTESKLRALKENQCIIRTTLERIEVYKRALSNPEEHKGLFLGTNREPGMPSGKGYKPTSPVEYEVLSGEKQAEILKQWIKDEHSRIYPLQIEVEQVTGALNALPEQQRFIIESRYFENMYWREVEDRFNDKYRKDNYITFEGLKDINRKSLQLITKILKPYYMNFSKQTLQTTDK